MDEIEVCSVSTDRPLGVDLEKLQEYYNQPFQTRDPFAKLSTSFSQQEYPSCANKELRSVIADLAPSVVSVSNFFGVQRKVDCSGIIIAWDEILGEATVLTSARAVFTESLNEVIVRSYDGTIYRGEEEYVDHHHNFSTIKIKSTKELKVVTMEADVEHVQGMEVVALGRSFFDCSFLEKNGELIQDDTPLFGCEDLLSSTCGISELFEGGPLITHRGQLVGINFYASWGKSSGFSAHPLLTPTILACLTKWKTHSLIVRPWFGFTVVDSDKLPQDALEKLNLCAHDACLVVKQVYPDSPASDFRLCPGDTVTSFNEIKITSVKQFAQELRHLFDKLNAVRTGNGKRSTIQICIRRASSDEQEVFEALILPVSDRRFRARWPEEEYGWMKIKYGSQIHPSDSSPSPTRHHRLEPDMIHCNLVYR